MASTPRRPRPLADRTRLRLGMRLAAGMAPAQVARAEGLPEAELDALLARPSFARLVRDYRDLARLGREERLARLELLAFDVLEDAIAAGDTRVILFSNRAPSVNPSSRRRRQPPVGPHDGGPIGHRPPGLLEPPPVPRSLDAARPIRCRGPHRPSSLRRRLCRALGSLRGRHAAAA